jgi:hypothetical protein
MEYQKAYVNQAGQGAAIGGAFVGQGIPAPPTPRTIISAASRIETLNLRLTKTVESLREISSQLGAITPLSGVRESQDGATSACGAVHRLNDSADVAHDRLNEVDALLNSIMRALG